MPEKIGKSRNGDAYLLFKRNEQSEKYLINGVQENINKNYLKGWIIIENQSVMATDTIGDEYKNGEVAT